MLFSGISLTLLTGLLWSAIGMVYSRAAEKKVGFYTFLFFSSLFFATTSWSVMAPAVVPWNEILRIAAVMIPAGMAGQLGFLALREAMRRGSHGIGWCIAQAAMVCPFAVGILFWEEPSSAFRLSGMALLLGSLVPLACSRNNGTEVPGTHRAFLVCAFLAFLLLGLQQTLTLVPNRLSGISGAALGWRVPLLSLCGINWIGMALYRHEWAWREILPLAFLYGVLVAAGQWTLFLAVDCLSGAEAAGIAYPLAVGSSIVLFFLYTRVVRRERSGRLGMVGILLAVTGIFLLAF